MNSLTYLLLDYRFIAVIAAPVAAIAILLVERQKLKVYLLAAQYWMVAWLVLTSLPPESAIAKLVAGWIAVFILYFGAGRAGSRSSTESSAVGFPRGRVFRIAAVLLVAIGTIGVSFDRWIPIDSISPETQQAAMLLVALGLLGIGLYSSPLHVGISLVTVVSGFEIIYSAVEPSLAIIALLALVHLGIALVISYFEIIWAENVSEAAVQ
jgi:hypothetical protein